MKRHILLENRATACDCRLNGVALHRWSLLSLIVAWINGSMSFIIPNLGFMCVLEVVPCEFFTVEVKRWRRSEHRVFRHNINLYSYQNTNNSIELEMWLRRQWFKILSLRTHTTLLLVQNTQFSDHNCLLRHLYFSFFLICVECCNTNAGALIAPSWLLNNRSFDIKANSLLSRSLRDCLFLRKSFSSSLL